jgi:hypothetical protein
MADRRVRYHHGPNHLNRRDPFTRKRRYEGNQEENQFNQYHQQQQQQHQDESYSQTNVYERNVERRISSSIGAVHNVVSEEYQGVPSRSPRNMIIPEASKPEIQEVYVQPEILNRNKRIFGSLMGHLGLAKQKLEDDSALLEKRTNKIQAVVKRTVDDGRKLKEEQQMKFQQSILDARIKAINDLTCIWKNNLKATTEFIMTESEPRLAWKPANINQISRELLAKRRMEVLIILYIIYLLFILLQLHHFI